MATRPPPDTHNLTGDPLWRCYSCRNLNKMQGLVVESGSRVYCEWCWATKKRVMDLLWEAWNAERWHQQAMQTGNTAEADWAKAEARVRWLEIERVRPLT